MAKGTAGKQGIVRVQLQVKDQDVRLSLNDLMTEFPSAIRTAVKREGLRLKAIMQTGIKRGAPGGKRFKPIAESTKFLKKSSKPLIDKGDLINSINVDDAGERGLAVFVGVNRTQLGKKGQELWNIAEIHEFGTKQFKIPITQKMRWWFLFRSKKKGSPFLPLPGGQTHIYHPGIPARPFIQPSFEEWSQDVEKNVANYVEARSVRLRRKHGY